MSGYIKLHRGLLDWEWYSDMNCFRLFTHLLLKAYNGEDVTYNNNIRKGQIFISIACLSRETGLTVSQTKTALSKLIKTGFLTKSIQRGHQLFSINNYFFEEEFVCGGKNARVD
ncbi:MAG: hypothetical protein ACK5N8_06720 [Alphaproteobacteria bacterium]